MSDEPDIQSLDAPGVVKAAAALLGVAGLFTALAAVQLEISVMFYEPLAQWSERALLVMGAASLGLATQVTRMRMPRTLAATVLAVVMAPATTAWLVYCVTSALFSLMQLGSVAASWGAALLLPFAIPATKRAADMRKKLADAGMDLGF